MIKSKAKTYIFTEIQLDRKIFTSTKNLIS